MILSISAYRRSQSPGNWDGPPPPSAEKRAGLSLSLCRFTPFRFSIPSRATGFGAKTHPASIIIDAVVPRLECVRDFSIERAPIIRKSNRCLPRGSWSIALTRTNARSNDMRREPIMLALTIGRSYETVNERNIFVSYRENYVPARDYFGLTAFRSAKVSIERGKFAW